MMKVSMILDGDVLANCTLENFNYQVDPYVGCEHYCYYCYVLNQAKTDWAEEVLGYKDIEKRLDRELSGIPPQTIYMGWQTDPYQPCEAEYNQTRRVLELLLDKGFSASILTKSDLVLRDMDLLEAMPEASVSMSASFVDDGVRRLFEHHTKNTDKRIAALHELKSAGIGASALICPVIPHISAPIELLKRLESCTDKIWLYGLSISDESEANWQNVRQILNEHFPEMKAEIEAAVFSREHPYWSELKRGVRAFEKANDMNLSIHF